MTVSSTPNQDPSRVADQTGPAAHEQAAPRRGSTRTLALAGTPKQEEEKS